MQVYFNGVLAGLTTDIVNEQGKFEWDSDDPQFFPSMEILPDGEQPSTQEHD